MNNRCGVYRDRPCNFALEKGFAFYGQCLIFQPSDKKWNPRIKHCQGKRNGPCENKVKPGERCRYHKAEN
jgi:hypothetical protein